MPDIERLLAIIAEFIQNYQLKDFFSTVFTYGLHTILGVICLALALTSFFPNENSKNVFLSFMLGGLFHLLLDMIMYPWPNMGLILFYPFLTGPRATFSFHLVWTGSFIPLIIISFCVGITVLIDIFQKKSLISLSPIRQLFTKEKINK